MSDFWTAARELTPSRIGLGRRGDGVATADTLAFDASHAIARDAIHHPLDVDAIAAELREAGWPAPTMVTSAAPDRATYLRRPDLGRRLAEPLTVDRRVDADIAVVLADGLSARAIEQHSVPLITALRELLGPDALAPPIIALQARVALGDEIAHAVHARLGLVLIGERPGLSVSDSLGAYLTWDPRPGVLDSARNCVSNIRQPGGLSYAQAALTIASLIAGARELGVTGVALKDTSGALAQT